MRPEVVPGEDVGDHRKAILEHKTEQKDLEELILDTWE